MILLSKPTTTNGSEPKKSEIPSDSMNHHYLFLACSIFLYRNEDNRMQEIANEIYNYVHEKFKEVDIEYLNYKNNKYNVELGNFDYTHPFIRKTPFEKDILIEALQEIIKRKEFQSKKGDPKTNLFASAFAMTKAGWFGTGADKIEQKEFLEWIKEIKRIKQGAFSNHIVKCKHTAKFPNWDARLRIACQNIEFQKTLLNEYWSIALKKNASSDNH